MQSKLGRARLAREVALQQPMPMGMRTQVLQALVQRVPTDLVTKHTTAASVVLFCGNSRDRGRSESLRV